VRRLISRYLILIIPREFVSILLYEAPSLVVCRPKGQCCLGGSAATLRGRCNNDGVDVFADFRLRVCSRFQPQFSLLPPHTQPPRQSFDYMISVEFTNHADVRFFLIRFVIYAPSTTYNHYRYVLL